MELVLIRHGLPVRIERQDGAPADPPLSAEGRDQARRLAQWLAPQRCAAVYASPLLRAIETAGPLSRALGLEVRVEPGVRELDADSAHYVPLEELKREDYSAWRRMMDGGLYAGVDLGEFRREVTESLSRIAGQHRGERVAVFCHGGVINVWAGSILGVSDPPLFFDPTYTSVNRFLVASSGQRSVVSLGEAEHLRDDVSVRRAAEDAA